MALLSSVVVLWTLVGSARRITDGDAFWQTRSGLDILHFGSSVVRPDPYSWTLGGREWTANSWGWNTVLGWGYELIDINAIGVAVLALSMTLVAMLCVQAHRRGVPATTVAIGLTMSLTLLTPDLVARPQLFTDVAVVVGVIVLNRLFRSQKPLSSAALLAVLFLLQLTAINVHLAAIVMVPLVASASLAWFVRSERRFDNAITALVPPALVMLATFMTPLGAAVVSQALAVHATSSAQILEWRSGFTSLPALVAAVLGGVAVVSAWRNGRTVSAGATAFAVLLALFAVRFVPLLTALVFAELMFLAHGLITNKRLASSTASLVATVSVLTLLVAMMIGTASTPVVFAFEPRPLVSGASTTMSLDAVRAVPTGCRTLNDYSAGGPLILYRPDVQVSIDSRSDLYGSDMIAESMRVWQEPQFGEQWMRNGNVGCVLTNKSGLAAPMVTSLRKSAEWRLIFEDRTSVVFVRS